MRQKTFIFREPEDLCLGGKDLKIKVEYRSGHAENVICNHSDMFPSETDRQVFGLRYSENLEIAIVGFFWGKKELTGIHIRVIEFDKWGGISDVSEYCVSRYK